MLQTVASPQCTALGVWERLPETEWASAGQNNNKPPTRPRHTSSPATCSREKANSVSCSGKRFSEAFVSWRHAVGAVWPRISIFPCNVLQPRPRRQWRHSSRSLTWNRVWEGAEPGRSWSAGSDTQGELRCSGPSASVSWAQTKQSVSTGCGTAADTAESSGIWQLVHLRFLKQ